MNPMALQLGQLFDAINLPNPTVSTGTSPTAPPQPVTTPERTARRAEVRRDNVFDNAMRMLFGTQDSDLSEEEMSQRTQRRNQAASMAQSAMENPGESFMNGVNVGGSGFGLEDLARIVGTLMR